jgi:D-lactate dehydrogenase (cytochrome)
MLPTYNPINKTVAEEIRSAVGDDCVLCDAEHIEICAKDTSDIVRIPEMVVQPDTTGKIAQLVKLANRHRFPVTPRGAGTGLVGGALAAHGGVVISLAAMNRIRSVDSQNLIAEVEPGVITSELRKSAKEKGLFYPPDPASLDTSTIGGNAATNAGGPACVKYGTTRDYILGLEAVMPNGEVIFPGVKTRKGVVGYDLTHLIVGSEGTLGIITGLTLKLIPHPPVTASMVAIFSDLHSAIQTVTDIMVRGHQPSAVEFMDFRCLELVSEMLPFRLPSNTASLLLIETDGTSEQTESDIKKIAKNCEQMGASDVLPANTEQERDQLWEIRRQISLRIHDAAGMYLSEDVVVPISRIADLVDTLPALENRFNLKIYAFGHAGDGNIHLNFTTSDANRAVAMEQGVQQALKKVLALGGTISGEHGIGLAKKPFIEMELSQESVRLQMEIKRLFDPNLILNPGKIFNWPNELRLD